MMKSILLNHSLLTSATSKITAIVNHYQFLSQSIWHCDLDNPTDVLKKLAALPSDPDLFKSTRQFS